MGLSERTTTTEKSRSLEATPGSQCAAPYFDQPLNNQYVCVCGGVCARVCVCVCVCQLVLPYMSIKNSWNVSIEKK